jgi:nicotinate-nucleotide pyrophosphorylase (carboxylating)
VNNKTKNRPTINFKHDLDGQVRRALEEDIGDGDVSAALIPAQKTARATVICRETATICGLDWFNKSFTLLDDSIEITWHVQDGDQVEADDVLCDINGNARILLTAERTALNFLQTLSATATLARTYANTIAGQNTEVLDTRKTIPGLRMAQKYAVFCGGCSNHRIGLYDAVLIKENHIAAAESISQTVQTARQINPDKMIEVEVETLPQLQEALSAGADRILLDNMNTTLLKKAVAINAGRAELEASGGITLKNIKKIAQTGVDYISIGALTKDITAIDLSMRIHIE